jgi:hypothetical protein
MCVSPANEEEARRVVQTAMECGLKQVWLVLPLIPTIASDSGMLLAKSKALLTAAINEVQKAKSPVRIVAGVRLFRLPLFSEADPLVPIKALPEPIEQDVTITGERPSEMARRRVASYIAAKVDPASSPLTRQPVYDWTAPGTAGIAGRITRRLSEVAATPGVSGMVLLDISPPGYNLPLSDKPVSLRVPQSTSNTTVGYTPSSRAAFIRSSGIDPIDITSNMAAGSTRLRLPFLDSGFNTAPETASANASTSQWNQFRSVIISKTLTDLRDPLMASLPKAEGDFPVYLQNLDADSTTAGGWFFRWEKKDALPRRSPSEWGKPQSLYPAAQKVSSLSLLSVSSDVPIAQQINTALTNNKGPWAGLVLNFSEVPVRRALELVQGVVPPSAAR